MSRSPGENLKDLFYLFVFALCKFGHKILDVSNTISARSFTLGQLIEDNIELPGEIDFDEFYFFELLPFALFRVIAL